MRIAVVGAGVSGLVAAYVLQQDHEVTVFEAEATPGGHSHTVEIPEGDRMISVDTGFIVFNELNYPGFCRLLARLRVEAQDSEMSFSVRDEESGLEYRGSSLDTLFVQRRNLLSPPFYRMLGEIVRFYRQAPALLDVDGEGPTLGEYLERGGYSPLFIEKHILPMGAALWSSGTRAMRFFPAKAFVRFFHHHRMLSLRGRPQWRTVRGGSGEYVRALAGSLDSGVRTSTPVMGVHRGPGKVEVETQGGRTEEFDHVILACHSDQSLAMLRDPSDREREILGAMAYTSNEVVLHTDPSVLPRNPRAWSSWNVHLLPGEESRVVMTYYMNRLQNIDSPVHYCVSLNRGAGIDESRVIRRFTYHHPLYTAAGVAAQGRRAEIDGVERTHFCGAYWGFGFHEDGVQSALAVTGRFGSTL